MMARKEPAVQLWEYKIVWIDVHMSPVLTMARWGVPVEGEKKKRESQAEVEKYITQLGAEGWELVSVINGTDQAGIITRAILWFKRPRSEQ
jgi:hypothetical protein